MQKQFMDIIRNNVLSMEALVTDISDLNKINSGRMKLDSKMTTFGQVIMDAQKQTEALTAKLGHQVTWDIPHGLPILVTDAKQLAKIIVKLVQNALQYTPPGAGQITITAVPLEGNLIQVSVTDNGIGMKSEEVARLGEAFFRADHELVTSQKGYGLGIPVAFGLLNMMKSPVTVNSEPGVGTTVSFQISGMG
jgi:two-component system phosphate regulon sensor histidine kinase PhoR